MFDLGTVIAILKPLLNAQVIRLIPVTIINLKLINLKLINIKTLTNSH